MPDRRQFLRSALVPGVAAGALLASGEPTLAKDETPAQFTGKVLPLKDLLEKAGSKLDRDAEPFWLALVTAEGKIYPVIKDDGGRRFFKDEQLRNREVRITGRLVAGSDLLQVLSMVGLKDGKAFDLYYWCDICSIKRYEKMQCECCGGPMELREAPVEK
jgi:hypothetical protein